MHLSRRVPVGSANELARLRAKLLTDGVAVAELTDTNPTNYGLADERISDILARATTTCYEPDPRGLLSAREALAARFGGEPGHYWLTASTSEAYSWLFALLGDPGDQVAIPAPGYPLIEPLARLSGLEVGEYRTFYVARGWEYDLDSVAAKAAGPGMRALVVVNPNNPTGALTDSDAAAQLAAICAEHGLALIADEVFLPFSDGGVPVPADFTLDGLSKLLAAPGLKLGWIKAPSLSREAAAALDVVADTYLSANSAVQRALPELLALADDTVARVNARLRANLDALRAAFGPRVRPVQGGWVALVDMGEDVSQRLLLEEHVYAHPGWFYGLDARTLVVSLLPSPPSAPYDALRRVARPDS
ncbi:MAG: pyridoxal phosphate-dependent aminotransferase [Propionibacteriaceae bacterium]|jgi:aspartate/methionine/tyrosine aminotransferase|nr:pyridoxal phosphate-dependent aminotransferase [Propionibacteriaceae bacterium]